MLELLFVEDVILLINVLDCLSIKLSERLWSFLCNEVEEGVLVFHHLDGHVEGYIGIEMHVELVELLEARNAIGSRAPVP